MKNKVRFEATFEKSFLNKHMVNVLASSLCLFVIVIYGIAQTYLATHFLDKYSSGLWLLMINIASIIIAFDFGLGVTLSRELGFARKKLNTSLRDLHLYVTIKSFIKYLACFVFIIMISVIYFSPLKVQFKAPFYIFTLGIFVRIIANPNLAFLYGKNLLKYERMIRASGPLIGIILSFYALKKGYNLLGLSAAYTMQALFVYLLSYLVLRKKFPIGEFKAHNSIKKIILKRILDPCYQYSVITIGALLIFQSGNFIIALVKGPVFVNEYAPVLQVTIGLFAVTNLLTTALSPSISILKGKNQVEKIRSLLSMNVRLSLGVMLLMVIFLVTNKYIFELWLGKQIVINPMLLYLMFFTVFLEAHHVICATTAMATGYYKFSNVALISGVMTTILGVLFVYNLGVVGMGLAIFMSQLVTNNWYAVYVSLKHLDIGIYKYLFDNFTRILVYGMILYIIADFFRSQAYVSESFATLIYHAIALTVSAFLAGLFILLKKSERLYLYSYIKLRKNCDVKE